MQPGVVVNRWLRYAAAEAAMSELCQACGACCASYRVSFHRGELANLGGTVPRGLTEPAAAREHRQMRRNPDDPGRCIGLQGTVGEHTACSVYALRPTPCHDFAPSLPGAINSYCDEARRRHGLPPLVPP